LDSLGKATLDWVMLVGLDSFLFYYGSCFRIVVSSFIFFSFLLRVFLLSDFLCTVLCSSFNFTFYFKIFHTFVITIKIILELGL
jgi:hypothetical protein